MIITFLRRLPLLRVLSRFESCLRAQALNHLFLNRRRNGATLDTVAALGENQQRIRSRNGDLSGERVRGQLRFRGRLRLRVLPHQPLQPPVAVRAQEMGRLQGKETLFPAHHFIWSARGLTTACQ